MAKVMVEAETDETLLDVERELIRHDLLLPLSFEGRYKWCVVTASGEEIYIRPTEKIGEVVDKFESRELKVSVPIYSANMLLTTPAPRREV
ncbi:MAG: hypothetical protein ACP5IE_08555 [Infirmifilum sp.]